MNREKARALMEKYPRLIHTILNVINRMPFNNSIRMTPNNTLSWSGLLKDCRIEVTGRDNVILVKDYARLNKCCISIHGNNNVVEVHDWAFMHSGEIVIEDDNNGIFVGQNTIISGKTHLAAIEGTKIRIGDNCLFSSNITIRTGDSHSILSWDGGNRINMSKSVEVCDRVWVGNGATILKGVTIQSHSVVGTQAVVTKSPGESNCVLAGNPARIIKSSIKWCPERVHIDVNKER